MHDPKEFLMAAAVAALGFSGPVDAQKDAAQKASEGAVDHWIEFYKAEQKKTSPKVRQGATDPVRPEERMSEPPKKAQPK